MTPARDRQEIFDPTALLRLAHGVDAEFVGAILQAFRDELDNSARALESSLRRGNDDDAKRVAHALKSAAAQVGATALSKLCRSIELQPITDVEHLADKLSDLVEQTRRAADQEAMSLVRRSTPRRVRRSPRGRRGPNDSVASSQPGEDLNRHDRVEGEARGNPKGDVEA